MVKKILITTITIFIAVSGFLTGFFSVGVISVYAAVNDDAIYVPLRSQNDAVKAFQAYCKSRDLTIEGSLTDAVTTFTTGAFNSACNELGIDITELQAEIKAEYDSSGEPVKFFFNDTGVMAMNRIFSQFLQDNELSVGDSVQDQNVYVGYTFTDADGYTCLCTSVPSLNSSISPTNVLYYGTVYRDSYNTVVNSTFDSQNYSQRSYTFKRETDNANKTVYLTFRRTLNSSTNTYEYSNSKIYVNQSSNVTNFYRFSPNSYLTICVDNNGKFQLYKFGTTLDGQPQELSQLYNYNLLSSENSQSCTVFLTTNNTVINNNNYEGDTYITNEGDTIINPTPVQPNDPNDTIHNVPQNPLGPDGIDLPDIDIPNLPIGNLSEKFPFSIPWDLVAFYAMLDAEPEAPRFNGTMDLTLVQWDYDIDLSPFDPAAELCRKLQFGLFVVGLIVASRSIIRG